MSVELRNVPVPYFSVRQFDLITYRKYEQMTRSDQQERKVFIKELDLLVIFSVDETGQVVVEVPDFAHALWNPKVRAFFKDINKQGIINQ